MSSKRKPATSITPVAAALSAAAETTRQLLTGSGSRGRWQSLALLAAMAGLVGVGAAPPPLGLLSPLWTEPALREAVLSKRGVGVGLGLLAVILLLMGAIGRSFTLGFLKALETGTPCIWSYRSFLGAGIAHFAWSSAISIPLYAVLFVGEALVARDTMTALANQVTLASASDLELLGLVLSAYLKFWLILVPWSVLTLPVWVWVYELTPAKMAMTGTGPIEASRLVTADARRQPGAFASILLARYLLQLAGSALALVAFLASVVISSPLTASLVATGWQLSRSLGGITASGGAGAITVSVLFALVVLYGVLCTALLPVTVFLNTLVIHFLCGLHPRQAHQPL